MKIGIIADIHNNVLALESVLTYLESANCDEVICCGDIIGIGPYPEETVQKIMAIPHLKTVLGNHEKYLIAGLVPPFIEGMSDGEVEHHQWEHSILSESSKKYIQALPRKLELKRKGYNILVMHYAMDENEDFITTEGSADLELYENLFSKNEADIVIFGHRHEGVFYQTSTKMFINPGSLGCPHKLQGLAKGGILEIDDNGARYESFETVYNLSELLHTVDALHYPDFKFIKNVFYGMS